MVLGSNAALPAGCQNPAPGQLPENSFRGSRLSPASLGNRDFSASRNSYITKNSYMNLFEKEVVLGGL